MIGACLSSNKVNKFKKFRVVEQYIQVENKLTCIADVHAETVKNWPILQRRHQNGILYRRCKKCTVILRRTASVTFDD